MFVNNSPKACGLLYILMTLSTLMHPICNNIMPIPYVIVWGSNNWGFNVLPQNWSVVSNIPTGGADTSLLNAVITGIPIMSPGVWGHLFRFCFLKQQTKTNLKWIAIQIYFVVLLQLRYRGAKDTTDGFMNMLLPNLNNSILRPVRLPFICMPQETYRQSLSWKIYVYWIYDCFNYWLSLN